METKTMTFGKHKGEDLAEVEAHYLLWLWEQDWIDEHPDIYNYIEKNLRMLRQDAGF